MPNARDVYIDVFIDSIEPLEFRVLPSPKNNPQLDTKPGSKPGLPIIEFHNNKHPGFNIHFVLQGDTHGYFFPPQPEKNKAVWSKCGSDCPGDEVHEVFQPLQVIETGQPPQRRVLKVHNRNPEVAPGKGQGPFQYNLRVKKDTDWKNLDPPGDNTNGGSSFTFSSSLTVGAVTGVTVGIGTAALVSNGFIPQDSLLYGIGGALVGLIVGFLFDRL